MQIDRTNPSNRRIEFVQLSCINFFFRGVSCLYPSGNVSPKFVATPKPYRAVNLSALLASGIHGLAAFSYLQCIVQEVLACHTRITQRFHMIDDST